jgi:hypothetical protein
MRRQAILPSMSVVGYAGEQIAATPAERLKINSPADANSAFAVKPGNGNQKHVPNGLASRERSSIGNSTYQLAFGIACVRVKPTRDGLNLSPICRVRVIRPGQWYKNLSGTADFRGDGGSDSRI